MLESDHASRMVFLGAWASAFYRVGVAPFLPSPGEETLEERLLPAIIIYNYPRVIKNS